MHVNTTTEHTKLMVSIIVIDTSDELYGLELTLKSIINQTYKGIECLVAANSILNRSVIDQSFIVIEDGGVTAINLVGAAIQRASGEYVLLLNSGDVLADNEVLSTLLNKFRNSVDFIYGNMVRLFPSGFEDIIKMPSNIKVEDLLYKPLPLIPVALIRKSALILYDFCDANLRHANDWAFLVKALLLGTADYIYVDKNVAIVKVGRSGDINKLSVGHLRAIEQTWFFNHYLSHSLTIFFKEKKEIEDFYHYSRVVRLFRYIRSIQQKFDGFVAPIIMEGKYTYNTYKSRLELPFYKKKYLDETFKTPIIINNRNHVTYLKRLISSLEKRGYNNIYILDNQSSYPELLEYYHTTPYKVYHLGKNVGFCALWDTNIFDEFKGQYYVYTDSDLELVDECPHDFLIVLRYILDRYSLGKVGLSLLTDDLPEHYDSKDEVVSWEKEFQKNQVEALAFAAPVDTTFALYKPDSFGHAGMLHAFRASFPYSARHLPWYENSKSLTYEQDYYYRNSKTSTHWSKKVIVEEG